CAAITGAVAGPVTGAVAGAAAGPAAGPGRLLRGLLLGEHPPQHFADERLRQLLAELDQARRLVRRELLAAVRDDLVGRRRLARLEHDKRLDCLAAVLIGHAD